LQIAADASEEEMDKYVMSNSFTLSGNTTNAYTHMDHSLRVEEELSSDLISEVAGV
jgi:hypothetical protein